LRVLYVEDTPIDVALVRHTLARAAPDFTLEVAGTLALAKARLADSKPLDMVLCDLHLPDGSGLEVLAHIRARGLPLAVVILTGTGDEEAVVAALKAGADAYLIKNREPMDQLPKTLTKALAHFRSAWSWRGRPLKALYAEDDASDIDLTRRYLAQHAPHIQLDVLDSADAVLARLPENAATATGCDVLVLDYRLAGGDALELIKALREERGLTLPIVLVTGQGSEAIAARALHLGVDEYLIKHAGYLQGLPSTLESVCHKAKLIREQAALMESEARIRLILDSTAEAIYGNDMEGRCTFVNPACLRILGYQRAEDLVGRPMHSVIHHSHADGRPYPREDCQIYRAYLRDEAIHRDDEVFWHRDGHPIPVEYWSYPMHRDGQVVGAVATFFDISERKRAEEKLRQAAMVFESTRDGVMITDLEARILAVNRAFTSITGYAEEEVRGKNPNMLHSGRQDQAFYQDMWTHFLHAGYWQGEVWNRRKNGEVYPQWITLSRVSDQQGVPTHYVGVFTDLSQIKRNEEQLDRLAHYDPLTDLPNRSLLKLRLDHALERANRHGQRVGVLYIDLDHFKAVNDSLGHETGDDLLLSVVSRFKGRIREEDTLGRLGGDGFLLLLEPIAEAQEAAEVARDLLDLLALPFTCSGGREVFLGTSIGISIYPDDGGSFSELLRGAETALSQAKEQGRNRLCFYTDGMNADALAMLELETALRRSLERDELVLHYQPKVDLQNGHICGVEALLRWRRDDSGLVPPASFIPLAEKSGLIVSIGAWVIDAACRQIRAWCDAGIPEVRVAVNVSACQFRMGDLEETVARALERHQVPPQQLELELTESMLMEDPEAAARLLDRLKRIGVKLSLDDFGTGYSSFAYLSRFPIDALKIDQSFVRGIVTEPDAASIVSAVIGLARRLRLQVVAEGVESEAQLGYLRKQGCEMMQGYYFSEPVPAEEVADMLRRGKSLPAAAAEAGDARTLLLVDDEANVLSALRRMLRNEGYRILTASGAREGLELLATHSVQVILSDQRMPEMNGTEFLGRVRELHPDTVRIILSGYSELDTIIQAVNQGAIYKFLIKPWDDDQLREHIRDAFRYCEAILKPRARSTAAAT
jgi:diguanylate cyclase (GGDEF)-like protein/PAS domain S-box-containing protein